MNIGIVDLKEGYYLSKVGNHRKFFLSFVLNFIFIFLALSVRVFAEIPITSCEELQNINGYEDYYIANDIDCSDTIKWNDEQGFEPISSFKGTLDGNGKTISKIYINRTGNAGIFDSIYGNSKDDYAKVFNLIIRDAVVSSYSTFSYAGILSGTVEYAELKDIYLQGNVQGKYAGCLIGSGKGVTISGINADCLVGGSETDFAGGIAAMLNKDFVNGKPNYLSDIVSSGSVTFTNHGGGVAGYAEKTVAEKVSSKASVNSVYSYPQGSGGLFGKITDSSIKYAVFNGTVYAKRFAGGIVGSVYNNEEETTSIENSFNYGFISGSDYVGGITGYFSSYHEDPYGALITNSVNSGKIKYIGSGNGGESFGGISGYLSEASIKNSANFGNIETAQSDYVGGIVGEQRSHTEIEKCYSIADLDGYQLVGGLVGSSEGEIINSYSSGEISCARECGGLVGEAYNVGFGGGLFNCYSVAKIYFTDSNTGPVIGRCNSDWIVSGTFYGTDTSGIGSGDSSCSQGTGKTSSQLKTSSTFSSWPISDLDWNILSGKYPHLAWEQRFYQATCGNGIIEFGEECDDADLDTNDGCDLCKIVSLSEKKSVCGNGLLEEGEECDMGLANSDTNPNTCRTSCLNPYCGDGVLDEQESCDDSNNADGDGCASECTIEKVDGCDFDSILIRTPEDFFGIINNMEGKYCLANDIDFSGKDFNPIGLNEGIPFKGSLDGAHRTLKNIQIIKNQAEQETYGGIFARLASAKIMNLHIDNLYLEGNYVYYGGLAGHSYSDNSKQTSIFNVSVNGKIVGISNIGGFFGKATDTYFEGCKADVEIIVTNRYTGNIGGFVGYVLDYRATTWMEDCYSKGSMSVVGGPLTTNNVGGIFGKADINYDPNYELKRVYSYVKLIDCYSSLDHQCGGILGYETAPLGPDYEEVYWDIEVSGEASTVPGSGKGKTTAEMHDISLYEYWDLKNMWCFPKVGGYPVLRWELPLKGLDPATYCQEPDCEEGVSCCNGISTNLLTDKDNCGICGNKCDIAGSACVNGECKSNICMKVTVKNDYQDDCYDDPRWNSECHVDSTNEEVDLCNNDPSSGELCYSFYNFDTEKRFCPYGCDASGCPQEMPSDDFHDFQISQVGCWYRSDKGYSYLFRVLHKGYDPIFTGFTRMLVDSQDSINFYHATNEYFLNPNQGGIYSSDYFSSLPEVDVSVNRQDSSIDNNHISVKLSPSDCANFNDLMGEAIYSLPSWAKLSCNDGVCSEYVPIDGCGDGDIDVGEECDDGNDISGDGCFECRIDAPEIEGYTRCAAYYNTEGIDDIGPDWDDACSGHSEYKLYCVPWNGAYTGAPYEHDAGFEMEFEEAQTTTYKDFEFIHHADGSDYHGSSIVRDLGATEENFLWKVRWFVSSDNEDENFCWSGTSSDFGKMYAIYYKDEENIPDGCTDSDTRPCTDLNGCLGEQTCNAGVWGEDCRNILNFCDTDCDGARDKCSDTTCEPAEGCACDDGQQSADCTTSNGCDGIITCSSGRWTECEVPKQDLDNDGYYDFSCSIYGLEKDCDDSDDKINPGAPESCNSIDDNCNGLIDESEGDCEEGEYCVSGECKECRNSADCDDGLFCNGQETCEGGVCIEETGRCDDGNDYTIDICDEEDDICKREPNDEKCDDHIDCTEDSYDLAEDKCKNTPYNSKCLDNFACTENVCNPDTGCEFIPDNGLCDDGIDCTDDTCSPNSGCELIPNDDNCEDVDKCLGTMKCVADSGCELAGEAITCTNMESFNTCDHSSDNNPYTRDIYGGFTSECINGKCTTNTQMDISHECDKDCGAECTSESVEQDCICESYCSDEDGEGLKNDHVYYENDYTECLNCECSSCSEIIIEYNDLENCPICTTDDQCKDIDGLYCNGNEICFEGACVNGEPVICDDGVECTMDACNEDKDSCEIISFNDDKCDNGNPCDGIEVCTENGCKKKEGSVISCEGFSTESSTECDGNYLKTIAGYSSQCLSQNSGSTPEELCSKGQGPLTKECVVGQCDAECGENSDCLCSENVENYQEYKCIALDDDNIFDDYVRYPKYGECNDCTCGYDCGTYEIVKKNDGTNCPQCLSNSECSNGLWCDGQEKCIDGHCQKGTQKDCSSNIACISTSCSEGDDREDNIGQCVYDDSNCECKQNIDCDDDNLCTDDECNENFICENTFNIENDCNNGLWCDGIERCDIEHGCVSQDPPVCDDQITCTQDSCSEGDDITDDVGKCVYEPTAECSCTDGSDCSDNNICTDDTCNEKYECENLINDEKDKCCNGGVCIHPGSVEERLITKKKSVKIKLDKFYIEGNEFYTFGDNTEILGSDNNNQASTESSEGRGGGGITNTVDKEVLIQEITEDFPIILSSSSEKSLKEKPIVELLWDKEKKEKLIDDPIYTTTEKLENDEIEKLKEKVIILKNKDEDKNGLTIIHGADQFMPPGKTKTAYVDKISDLLSVCIKDSPTVYSSDDFSKDCSGKDEYFIICNGSSFQGSGTSYTCTVTEDGGQFKITGLKNSGVQQQCIDKDEDGYGDYCTLGNDCDDNDADINPSATEVCGNSIDEDCDGEDKVCPSTPKTTTSRGSGSGGGGGGSYKRSCDEEWSCSLWGSCKSNGVRYRDCKDVSDCGTTTSKPEEMMTCVYVGDCYDGLMNSDEEGIDCGGRCSKACEEVTYKPDIRITAEPINAEVLDTYKFKVYIENYDEKIIENLKISVNKWATENFFIESILPKEKKEKEFLLNLPGNPSHNNIIISVLLDDVAITEKSVQVKLTVPKHSMKLKKDTLSGKVSTVMIYDNRGEEAKDIGVEYTVNKGKETYLVEDVKEYPVSENELYHTEDFLYMQNLPTGNYIVNSVFYADGEKIGEDTVQVDITGDRKAFNAAFIFYILLGVIVFISVASFIGVSSKKR